MNIIKTFRGGGKTTQLIKRAAELEGYNVIVCINKQEAQRVWNLICERGLDIPLPITYDEFLQKKYEARHVTCFLLDNADLFLRRLCSGVKLDTITFTEGAEE